MSKEEEYVDNLFLTFNKFKFMPTVLLLEPEKTANEWRDAVYNEFNRLTAENERLREEIASLSHENDELKAELQKLKPNTQRKATDKMIEYAKIIASYTNKPLPNFNNFDETQNYIRKNRQSYLERLEIDSEANALVIDSRRDY